MIGVEKAGDLLIFEALIGFHRHHLLVFAALLYFSPQWGQKVSLLLLAVLSNLRLLAFYRSLEIRDVMMFS